MDEINKHRSPCLGNIVPYQCAYTSEKIWCYLASCADYSGIDCASYVNLGYCETVAAVRDTYCTKSCGTCGAGAIVTTAAAGPAIVTTATTTTAGWFTFLVHICAHPVHRYW